MTGSTGETPPESYDAVVVAGGRALRFGSDKLVAVSGGRPLLEHALGSVAGAGTVVVVGPQRPVGLPGRLVWTREDPPGGGPLSGVAAGAPHTSAPVVAVVAGDLLDAHAAVEELLARLRTAPDHVAAAVAVDGAGAVQPLLAVWRRPALLARLEALEPTAGRPARLLYDAVAVERVAVPEHSLRDVDQVEDLPPEDR